MPRCAVIWSHSSSLGAHARSNAPAPALALASRSRTAVRGRSMRGENCGTCQRARSCVRTCERAHGGSVKLVAVLETSHGSMRHFRDMKEDLAPALLHSLS
ncbi:unnamed protein product [Taenia asiatica]|uniref:LOB domain-containing protein n=1 Tax=Taenia asiatica TaxID=60517 RepID=A0A0R3WCD9_TAEAS|nr:unnamed protein product [Taenia asiatica]